MKQANLLSSLKNYITGNLVIKGTLILTIAGFATRIIGFYNRIFLSGLIGATQMGIYQLILPLYMVAFAFTTYGNELALTKLVSEYYSRREYATTQILFRVCMLWNLLLSLIVSTVMFFNADWLCLRILSAPECATCLRIICLGIPFMAMKGAIHGYFLGLKKSSIHGISDLLEQTGKVLGLYILSTYICLRNHYDADFAVWGIVIGEFLSFLYSVLVFLHHKHKNPHSNCQSAIYAKKGFHIFLRNAIPLTTNRLALTILQSMESIMIPSALFLYYGSSTDSLTHYGVFTGMAFPFIMFPSTITNALSTMLLPAVSSAKSTQNKNYLSALCEKSMHFCLLIGFFSCITFFIFGNDIGSLFFQNKEAGIYLYQLSFLCPLIYLATTLSSVLNGLGHATYNLIFTVIATTIRISFIQLTIPWLGMKGYIFGLFASYLFLTFVCLHHVQKEVCFPLHFLESMFLPACVFSILGAAIYSLYLTFSNLIPSGQGTQLLLLIGMLLLYGLISIPPFLQSIYKKQE